MSSFQHVSAFFKVNMCLIFLYFSITNNGFFCTEERCFWFVCVYNFPTPCFPEDQYAAQPVPNTHRNRIESDPGYSHSVFLWRVLFTELISKLFDYLGGMKTITRFFLRITMCVCV